MGFRCICTEKYNCYINVLLLLSLLLLLLLLCISCGSIDPRSFFLFLRASSHEPGLPQDWSGFRDLALPLNHL